MRAICIRRHGNSNAGKKLSKWKTFRNNSDKKNKIIFYDYARRRSVQFVIEKD